MLGDTKIYVRSRNVLKNNFRLENIRLLPGKSKNSIGDRNQVALLTQWSSELKWVDNITPNPLVYNLLFSKKYYS
jgi:hypothetical protein